MKLRPLVTVIGLVLSGGLGGGASLLGAPSEVHAQPARARGWLGVSMEDTRGEVRVRHVVRTSPAERAGVRGGDRIVRVDGVRVSLAVEVIRVVSAHAVGDVVELTLAREGKEQAVRVTLGAFPSGEDMMRMDFVGSPAPAWRGVEAVSGPVPASIGQLRGRVVVLSFWATWCSACRMASPRLSELQARYGAQGLSVVGLSTDDPAEIAPTALRLNMRYAVGADRKGETTQAHHVNSLPSVFVIDKRGVVRDVSVGYDPGREAQTEALIRALLAEPAPAP